jgi:hypothetical protein
MGAMGQGRDRKGADVRSLKLAALKSGLDIFSPVDDYPRGFRTPLIISLEVVD